jgi:glycogen debranching enzyme
MKYSFRNPGERVGCVTGSDELLYRRLDSNYSTKWTGLWIPPYKYMDYHAFRVNGEWLGSGNLDGVEYGDVMRLHWELESLSVTEQVSPAEEFAGFRIELTVENTSEGPKAVRTGLELGVDIREKSEDLGPKEYVLERKSDLIRVKTGTRYLEIEPNDSFSIENDSYLKEHFPGEKQRCFVPGELGFKWDLDPGESFDLELKLRTDQEETPLDSRDLKNRYSGPFDQEFAEGIDSLLNLSYGRNDTGILAGHPWFQSYWARDTFWSLLGLIDAGEFELTHEMLKNFAERGLPGRIFLEGESDSHARSDTYPLFVIAAKKLERNWKIGETVEKGIEDAMDHLEMDGDLVDHPGEGTWMDTLERSPAVDLQSLWLEAAKLTGYKRESSLRNGLEEFVNEQFIEDSLEEGSARTVNIAVPLMFGHIEEEKALNALEKLNGEFSSRYGARTRSVADPGYDSSGYHTGSAWGLTTGWAACANFQYGNFVQGKNFLERLARTARMTQPGGFPEVLDAETGEILGCTEQAWSAAFMVHAIDSYMLGIQAKQDISAEPFDEVECERSKRIGDEVVSLEFNNGEFKVLDREEIDASG